MLDPVVLPLPMAVAIILALAAAALAYRRWLESAVTPLAVPAPTPGRHRLTPDTPQYRDWAAIAAERMRETHLRQHASALIPDGVADWRQPLTDFERAAGVLPPVVAGPGTWDDDTLRITLEPVDAETAVLSPVS